MITTKALKNMICQTIDSHSEEIIALALDIASEPELGFKEVNTANKVSAFMKMLGIEHQCGIALTGVKGILSGSSAGPNIALLGELDGVICSDAPIIDRHTGASHTCGHNLQIAGMLGAALGLKLSGAADTLSGKVSFIAVPAEEYIEIEERQKMRTEGKIRFLAGKQELVNRGTFNDVDMCMMFHSLKGTPEAKISMGSTSNGFLGKTIVYSGVAAHAAEAPEEGINALNAAILGIVGVNALRETFRDEDNVRVHPVITKGGDSVNSVPAEVKIETYVRANSIDALIKTNKKIDRAFLAGGYALGAGIEINTIPGHMPMQCSEAFNAIFKENALIHFPDLPVVNYGHFKASTDFGDLTHLMPAIHPFVGGVNGQLHTKDFSVADMNAAVLLPAKLMAMTVIDLLADQAVKAHKIINDFTPSFESKDAYLKFLDDSFERKVQK